MNRPPADRRPRAGFDEPTWSRIVVSYVTMIAIPAVLWLVSNPLLGLFGAATLVATAFALRRTLGVVRCVRHCQEIVVDLGGRTRITVTRVPDGESPCQ